MERDGYVEILQDPGQIRDSAAPPCEAQQQ